MALRKLIKDKESQQLNLFQTTTTRMKAFNNELNATTKPCSIRTQQLAAVQPKFTLVITRHHVFPARKPCAGRIPAPLRPPLTRQPPTLPLRRPRQCRLSPPRGRHRLPRNKRAPESPSRSPRTREIQEIPSKTMRPIQTRIHHRRKPRVLAQLIPIWNV